MTKPIEYSVRFPASARELYDLYIDPRLHEAFTSAPATVSPRANSKFSAFGGEIWGVTLFADPGKMIVQRWRSTHFRDSDPDSILVLTFTQERTGGRIDLAHINVPKQDHAGVTEGWKKYYWKPLKAFLNQRDKK